MFWEVMHLCWCIGARAGQCVARFSDESFLGELGRMLAISWMAYYRSGGVLDWSSL